MSLLLKKDTAPCSELVNYENVFVIRFSEIYSELR